MSLKRKASSGAKWTGIAAAVTATLQILQLAVLARLLAPEDFGLMAMVMIVLVLGQSYADMGISNAIIHRQGATRDQLSSLYWLNILAGAAVFVVVIALKPAIMALYDEPRLNELIPMAALIFLVTPPGQQFQVLLEKNLRFKELAVIDSGVAIVGAVVSISAALAGKGVFALVYGMLFSAAFKTLLLVAAGWREWRPNLHFRKSDLRGYLGFGLFQMGEKTVNYLNERFDQLLIATLLGAQELGYYNLAFGLVVMPIARINPVLTRVAFPVFARIQNDAEKLKSGYMTIRNVLAFTNFPLLLGLAAVAPVLVPLAFGDKWLPSVILIQILALVAMMRSLGNPIGSLLLAKGRADLGFYLNCLLPFILFPAVYVGARLGDAVGVSVGLLVATLFFFWVGYFFLVRRLLGPCLRPYLAAFGPAGLTASLMALAVAWLSRVLALDGFWLFAVQVTVGVFLYAALNWLLYRERTTAILQLAFGRDD